MTERIYFIVSFEKPERATLKEMREYLVDAVETWRGQLFPGDEEEDPDPMWELDPETVKVMFKP